MPAARQLDREQALRAMEKGEFGDDVAASHRRVAVLMTQDWCPQWASMKAWIYDLGEDVTLFEFIYNKSDIFDRFRDFKEKTWRNDRIPYFRYYLDGAFAGESNYLTREEFLKRLGL